MATSRTRKNKICQCRNYLICPKVFNWVGKVGEPVLCELIGTNPNDINWVFFVVLLLRCVTDFGHKRHKDAIKTKTHTEGTFQKRVLFSLLVLWLDNNNSSNKKKNTQSKCYEHVSMCSIPLCEGGKKRPFSTYRSMFCVRNLSKSRVKIHSINKIYLLAPAQWGFSSVWLWLGWAWFWKSVYPNRITTTRAMTIRSTVRYDKRASKREAKSIHTHIRWESMERVKRGKEFL